MRSKAVSSLLVLSIVTTSLPSLGTEYDKGLPTPIDLPPPRPSSTIVPDKSKVTFSTPYSEDNEFIDRLAYSFYVKNDLNGLKAFVDVSYSKNFNQFKANVESYPYLRGSSGVEAIYNNLDNIEKSGILGPEFNALMLAGRFGGNVLKTYGLLTGDQLQQLTFKEFRTIVLDAVKHAEANKSLIPSLEAYSQKMETNLIARIFPAYIVDSLRNKDIKDLLLLDSEDLKKLGQSQAQLDKKINSIVGTSDYLKNKITEEMKNAKTLEPLLKKSGEIKTSLAQLQVVQNIMALTGFKNDTVKDATTLIQLHLNVSDSINKWNQANAVPLKPGDPSPNWIMAANVTTACLMAVQMLSKQKSPEEVIMHQLSDIQKTLKVIDEKLNKLIELTHDNFRATMNEFFDLRYATGQINKKVEQLIDFQNLHHQLDIVRSSSNTVYDIHTYSKQCETSSSNFCNPNEIYGMLHRILLSQKWTDSDETNNIEVKIRQLDTPINNSEMRYYRQFVSNSSMLKTAAELFHSRLSHIQNPQYKKLFEVAAKQTESLVGNDSATVNPHMWLEVNKATQEVAKSTGKSPPKPLMEELKKQAAKISGYYSYTGSPTFQWALATELRISATEFQRAYENLREEIVKKFQMDLALDSSKNPPTLKLVNMPKELNFLGQITYCNDEGGVTVGPINKDLQTKMFYSGFENLDFQKFSTLEYLGAGKLNLCYFSDARDDRSRVPIFTYLRFIWNNNSIDIIKEYEIPTNNALDENGIYRIFAQNLKKRFKGVEQTPESVKSFLNSRMAYRTHVGRAYKSQVSTFMRGYHDVDYDRGTEVGEWGSQDWIVQSYFAKYAETINLFTNLNYIDKYGAGYSIYRRLDMAINKKLTNILSTRLSAMEDKSVPETNVKDNVFIAHNQKFQELLSAFEAYRLRFYLLKAFADQQFLDQRISQNCYLLTQDQRSSAHPINLLQKWSVGDFFESPIDREWLPVTMLKGTPQCMTNLVPPTLQKGLELLQ